MVNHSQKLRPRNAKGPRLVRRGPFTGEAVEFG
jgi:hypothetical protein